MRIGLTLFLLGSLLLHGGLFLLRLPDGESSRVVRNPIWIAPPSPSASVSAPKRLSKGEEVAEESEVAEEEEVAGGTTSSPSAPLSDVRFDQIVQWGNQVPEYPEEARLDGLEGQVLLELETENGRVLTAIILKSSGHPILDSSAQLAAHGWKIDETFRGKLRVPILFQLKQP